MPSLSSNRILIASILGVAVIFFLDLLIPLGVAVGALYILCFILISREPVRRVRIFAAAISFLIMLKLYMFFDDQTSWMAVANRLISVLTVWIAAFIVWQQRKLFEKMEAEREDHVQKLEVTNKRLSSIQQALNTHLYVSMTDAKGTITYTNENFCNVSGYTEQELIGANHSLLKSGEHDKAFYQNLWNTISSGSPWSGEVKNKTKDGSFYWSNTVIIPFFNGKKKITQYLAIRIPITDKKIIEEKQKEYVVSLEKILNDISHKLKSPIASCLGLTQLMEYQQNDVRDLVDIAIEHRKTCAHDLMKFSDEISNYIYDKTK